MYRLMILVLAIYVTSTTAFADCGTCKKDCQKETAADQLVDVDLNEGIVLGM